MAECMGLRRMSMIAVLLLRRQLRQRDFSGRSFVSSDVGRSQFRWCLFLSFISFSFLPSFSQGLS